MGILIQHTGFASAANDFLDRDLKLDEYLIKHPLASFFARVVGNDFKSLGCQNGDLLILDRALNPRKGQLVLIIKDGGFSLSIFGSKNRSHPHEEIWSPVTYIIREAFL